MRLANFVCGAVLSNLYLFENWTEPRVAFLLCRCGAVRHVTDVARRLSRDIGVPRVFRDILSLTPR